MSNSQTNGADQNAKKYFFQSSTKEFKKIPGAPIAYWLSKRFRNAFESNQVVEDLAEKITKGIFTGNNDLFLRFWFEIPKGCDGWKYYDKAGEARRWFGSAMHVIDWRSDGKKLLEFEGSGLGAMRFYGKPHFVWSGLSTGTPSFRFADTPVWFDDVSPSVVGAENNNGLLAYLNSRIATKILMTLNPTLHYQIGDVKRIPVPLLTPTHANLASACVAIARFDWDSYETSWDFTCLPLIHPEHCRPELKIAYRNLRAHWREATQEMQRLEKENNRIFINAYALQDEITPDVPLNEITLTCNPHYRYGGNKTEEELEALLLADTMREFISYAVGCMLGRYSLDKPGLILANQGETLTDYLKQVPQPSFMPDKDNVIPMLDGDWFADDIVERFRQFLRITFGEEHYEENLQFIEQALNIKDKRHYTLRDYFLGEFYTDHIKRYKKRPIYWLFSSPKGSFNALIYMHRYRPDTVSVVLNDYLREFRAKLDAHLQHLQATSISAGSSQGEKTKALKEINKVTKTIAELEDYEREVLYPLATQQIEIDLDDGVKVNYPKFGAALKKIPGLEAKDED